VRPVDSTDSAEATGYALVGAVRDFRVMPNGSSQPIVVVTARSDLYDVQYTWFVEAETWDGSGGPPAISLKTAQVNQICGHPHVQDFWTDQDQGQSRVLYNWAVIEVGTDDGTIADHARVRMDRIGDPSAFAAIDAVWKRLTDAGAR
jgi:hypothetical protein